LKAAISVHIKDSEVGLDIELWGCHCGAWSL